MSFPQAKQETQIKDYGQNIARLILEDNKKLNSLTSISIGEISMVFKIPECPDTNQQCKRIRSKLANIITEEKEQCLNYLQLPKFQNLSQVTQQSLKEILQQCWEDYQKRMTRQEGYNKYSKYLCLSENPKQIETFHLRLFQMVKSNLYYPYGNQFMSNNNSYPMMGSAPPSQTIPNQNNQNFGMFHPQMNIPQMNNFPPNFQNMPDPYFQNAYPPVKMQEGFVSGNNREQTFSQNGVQKEEAPPKRKYAKEKLSDQFTYSKNRSQKEVSQAANKQFWNCACRGRISADEKNFECLQCKKKFHLQCLLIPLNARQKLGVKKICPQCSLKNNNAFYEVIGDPLETFWSDDKELHKQKITIKGKKCKQIIQKRYSLQLRFIKVEGRTFFEWDEGKTEVMVKQEGGQVALKPKKNFLNEILIKEEMLVRGNGQDVKISLDCMRNSPKPDEIPAPRKTVMIYVAIYIVKKKTAADILSSQYEEVGDEYLNRFLKGSLEEIKLEVYDSTPRLITTPVRGSDCDHPEVFDLEQFVQHCVGLQTDVCFFCGKRCRNFKIDKKIQDELNKIREQIPNEQNQPSIIYYLKDGTFRWERTEPQNHVSSVNDDSQIPSFDSYGLDQGLSGDQMDIEQNVMSDSEDQNDNSKVKKTKKIKKTEKGQKKGQEE